LPIIRNGWKIAKKQKFLKVVDDENDVFIFWVRQHVTLLTDRDMVIKSRVK